jgi:mannose-1-phosphate guanylyltransferase/phosphomannomutase
MLPMVNIPMMEHVVNLLRQHGFEDIVVTVAFMANSIRTYFGDGSEFGVRMVYATESTPLGTAGSVRNARDELDERFLVISGDVLTDIDLTQVVDFHDRRGGLATLALKAVDNPLEFGIVITREDGSIERFLEKPTWGQVFSDTINTGIYVLEPEIFDFIPEGQPVDFSGESFPAALAAGKALYGYVADGYWEDVGTLEAYLKAHQDILDQKVQVDINGFQLLPGVWLGKGAEIDPSVAIEGPAVIGDNCVIGPGARLGSHCTLGRNIRIGDNAVLQQGSGSTEACSAVDRTCARGSGARRGSSSGTSASWAPTPRSGRGSRSTPSRRSRRVPSSTRQSSGSHEGRGPCSAGTGCRDWPTWTSAPSWPSACPWPGHRPSRRGRGSPRRGTPAGRHGC